jgi:hypothetical protein
MPDVPDEPQRRYDQRHQTVRGHQWNVAGDLHMEAPPKQDPAALLERGMGQLRAHAYQSAAESLRQAISVDPTMRLAYTHLAMALLRGRRPKALPLTEMRELDEVLGAAIAVDGNDGLLHWFRALVRFDFYDGNGMTCPAPTVGDIVAAARSCPVDLDALRALLRDVPMRGNALHSSLATALAR